MVIKKTKRPELPKLRRHRWRDGGWLTMEPGKIGMVVACWASAIALLVFFVRQQLGVPMGIADVLLGVAKTFVISYAVSGLFVVYLLWVAERELTPPPEEKKKTNRLKREEAVKAETPEAAPEPSQLDVMAEALERLEGVRAGESNEEK